MPPKKGKIYKLQCSNNTQFMGTSKFTHWALAWSTHGMPPKKGKIYKLQCSNNTQFMRTSKFTHGAHMACPPKKEKYTNYNVLIIHNLWGLPNLPIGSQQSDPKKGKIYKFQCSKNTQFMGTSKFTHGAHIACPQNRKNIQITMF